MPIVWPVGNQPETALDLPITGGLVRVAAGVSVRNREPGWEPFAVDNAGRLWTPMESKALTKRPNALLWTLMDAAWRSTDQEVACSSRAGRALRNSL
jgi:hypothetical protein